MELVPLARMYSDHPLGDLAGRPRQSLEGDERGRSTPLGLLRRQISGAVDMRLGEHGIFGVALALDGNQRAFGLNRYQIDAVVAAVEASEAFSVRPVTPRPDVLYRELRVVPHGRHEQMLEPAALFRLTVASRRTRARTSPTRSLGRTSRVVYCTVTFPTASPSICWSSVLALVQPCTILPELKSLHYLASFASVVSLAYS